MYHKYTIDRYNTPISQPPMVPSLASTAPEVPEFRGIAGGRLHLTHRTRGTKIYREAVEVQISMWIFHGYVMHILYYCFSMFYISLGHIDYRCICLYAWKPMKTEKKNCPYGFEHVFGPLLAFFQMWPYPAANPPLIQVNRFPEIEDLSDGIRQYERLL